MGWSCRAEASKALRKLQDNSYNQTGVMNLFYGKDKKKYMFEVVSEEYETGKIKVELLKYIDDTRVVSKGHTFISPTGKVSNRILKELLERN